MWLERTFSTAPAGESIRATGTVAGKSNTCALILNWTMLNADAGHAYDHHKFGGIVSLGTSYFRVIFLNIGYSPRPCERHSLRCFCFLLECRSKNLTFETLLVICFTCRVREKRIFERRNLVLPSFAKSTLCTRSRRKCFDSFDLRNSKYPILKFWRSLLICLESILYFSFQINFLRPLHHIIKVTFECKVL